MSRFCGILKVALVLALDFVAIYSLFENPYIASIAVGVHFCLCPIWWIFSSSKRGER